MERRILFLAACLSASILVSHAADRQTAGDSLPSWNDGAAKKAIVGFVTRVTTQGGAEFVPVEQRIAVFDNDGTLWSEQPMYFQLLFAFDRIRALAPKHPEWKDKEPFTSVIANDLKGLAVSGEKGLMEIMAVTHTGMTTEEFADIVRAWMSEARHPRFKRRYDELIYQPMLEVLQYLRASGFKTFIVSGGGVDCMRPWVEKAYGIPPEQVVGSSAKVKWEMRGTTPVLVRMPEVNFIDDKEGKPVGIHQFIGRRPIMAFGNSDGDLQMLQWTTTGPGARFGLIVHHTDADREWAYDRGSHVGALAAALDEAPRRGWVLADMKRDWKLIYPFQKP